MEVTYDKTAEQTLELLAQIASKTNSEVILFAIAVGIMGAIFIVIYFFGQKQMRKHELEQQKHELERQKQSDEREKKLLDIMSETASALKGLKMVIENTTTQSSSSISRIHERIDDTAETMSAIRSDVAVILKVVTKKPPRQSAKKQEGGEKK